MLTMLLLATLSADPGKSHSLSADKPHSQRWQMMQARRDAEVMRRNISRHHVPTKEYSDEDRAKARLYVLPKIISRDTAVRWAQLIVKDFPETPAGREAQEWLWMKGR